MTLGDIVLIVSLRIAEDIDIIVHSIPDMTYAAPRRGDM